MLAGASKERADRFSFELPVVHSSALVALEALRLLKNSHVKAAAGVPISLHSALVPSLEGMTFSFFAGLVALKWLSNWLENGRWYLFGIYCLVASAVVFGLYT